MPGDRVIVIGAGIVGICCGLSLQDKGWDVLLVDRDSPASGASSGNAGVISPWSNVPQALPGVWRSMPRWVLSPSGPVAIRPSYLFKLMPWGVRFLCCATKAQATAASDAMRSLNAQVLSLYHHHLNGTRGGCLFRDSMYLHVYRSAQAAHLESIGWQLRQRHNAPIEIIDGDALRQIEPSVSRAFEAAIVVKGQARSIDPGALGSVLSEKFVARGGRVRSMDVRQIERCSDGDWAVRSDDRVDVARTIVIAAGAWSQRLLEPFGIKLPLEAERGYHLLFKNPGVAVNNSIFDVASKFVVSSMIGGVRAAGTAEFAGLEAPPDYGRARVFARLTRRILPSLNVAEFKEWSGVRPSFPDSLPCIGEIPGLTGLFAAFGHSHYGLSMAPGTGQLVAELVTQIPPTIDPSPFSPERFT